jgi:hypothetical protein
MRAFKLKSLVAFPRDTYPGLHIVQAGEEEGEIGAIKGASQRVHGTRNGNQRLVPPGHHWRVIENRCIQRLSDEGG